MNDEINIMIELQHYWELVMQNESEIDRHRKSIHVWDKRLIELQKLFADKDNSLKNSRHKLKQFELRLEELNLKIVRIEQRKDNIKSERELEAQNNELKKLMDDKNSLENIILEYMEHVEADESGLVTLKNELDETSLQTASDIKMLNEKIDHCEKKAMDNRNKFNKLIDSLSPSTKTRFSKLINSKDGIAIAKLNGEICSHCNFQVPSSLAATAEKHESLNICTNCGRFIY